MRRRWAAGLALGLLVAGAPPRHLLPAWRPGWGFTAPERDATAPWLPAVAETLRARTCRDDEVALLAPEASWYPGYSYLLFRTAYLLGDRRLLPLQWYGEPRLENLARADFVVGVGTPDPPPGFVLEATVGPARIFRRATLSPRSPQACGPPA